MLQQPLNMMQVSEPPTSAAPPAQPDPPPVVITIKKPIVIKLPSKKETEAENKIMDANTMAVSSQVLIYVTAFPPSVQSQQKQAAWLKEQGPLGAVVNKDGLMMMGSEYYEWSLEYETDHEDDKE